MNQETIYSSLIQMVGHSESTTWNRFYNYLMANSILILAWATLYSIEKSNISAKIVMSSICILGGISGPFFSCLAARGRKFLNNYVDLGCKLENDTILWSMNLNDYKILNKLVYWRDNLPYKKASSHYILIVGPGLFTVFYIVLFIVSIKK